VTPTYSIQFPIPDDDIMWLAKTIFGEARGENAITQYLVGWVIRNRKEDRGQFRRQSTYKQVVLAPYQFSCWLEGDPNKPKVEQPWKYDMQAWKIAQAVALTVEMSPQRKNPIPGVLHYVDVSIADRLPRWAKQMKKITFELAPRIIFLK